MKTREYNKVGLNYRKALKKTLLDNIMPIDIFNKKRTFVLIVFFIAIS